MTSTRRQRVAVTALALALSTLTVRAGGGSEAPRPTAPAAEPKSPEEQAIDHYDSGIRMRDKAWKLEEKLSSAESDQQRDKIQSKIRKQFKGAVAQFQQATAKKADFYQAYSSLGYALRRLGQYSDSIAAYDRSLQIEPNYPEAIEYRAEAHLGLGRLEEAKEAYIRLFSLDRDQADDLLAAMRRWVESRRADPDGVDAATVDAFASWVDERGKIAGQTARLDLDARRAW